ncbi:MAG: HAD-IA family hydrolase [bacterium]|nr:HAD-IA family hydrolase [bacterium]
MIRAILFDLDNTLVDFLRMKNAGVDAAIVAMRDAGLSLDEEVLRRRIFAIYREYGIEYQEVFDRLLEGFPTPSPRLLAAAISGYQRAWHNHLEPYPGVRVTLAGLLKRGVLLGVVSDAPRKQAWLRLVEAGIEVFFDTVVAFEDTGKQKPHAAPFQLAMTRLGVGSGETLMVGDWPERDVHGAQALGVKTVFARYGDVHEVVEAGADFEIDQPEQLLAIVDQLGTPYREILPPKQEILL